MSMSEPHHEEDSGAKTEKSKSDTREKPNLERIAAIVF